MLQQGFIKYGQYGGFSEINGKPVLKFSLSWKENGEQRYMNNITAWMDDIDQRELEKLVDGRYGVIEYTESKKERNGKTYTNYTFKHFFQRADGYNMTDSEQLSDDDIPF